MFHERTSQDLKCCKICGRYLAKNYDKELCPTCQERELFSEVKEYIRTHDVRGTDVAEHFGIDPLLVRRWIQEGSIHYKGEPIVRRGGAYCPICGNSSAGGFVCKSCQKLQELQFVAGVYEKEKKDKEQYKNKDLHNKNEWNKEKK